MGINEEEVRGDRVEVRRIGRECGATWAKDHATPEAIKRLREIGEPTLRDWVDHEEDLESPARHGSTEEARLEVYEAIHGEIDKQAGKDDPWYVNNLTFSFFSNLDAGDWAHHWAIFYVGFIEGAVRYSDSANP